MTVDEAARASHDVGLALEVEPDGVYSAEVTPGTVGAQDPHPGFHVKTGATVRVRLSLGSQRIALLGLEGESVQGAERVLDQLGLRLARTATVNGQDGGNTVLASDPAMGSEVAPGSDVGLLVNKTPRRELWVTPSFVTLPYPTVAEFLTRGGFRIGQVHRISYPGVAGGTVLQQYPPGGSPLSRSDIVTLWVSQ
jgi:serine/threonine-protein kinase